MSLAIADRWGENEEQTVQTLDSYRQLMTKLLDNHNGKLVDAVGDNLLAQFTSIVNAVRCAIEIQTKLKEQNSKLVENRPMFFRITVKKQKYELEIVFEVLLRHAALGREDAVVGAEHVVAVVPYQPCAAQRVLQLSSRPRDAQRLQDRPHAAAGHLAHAQENESVAVGYQHSCGRPHVCNGRDFAVIARLPQ